MRRPVGRGQEQQRRDRQRVVVGRLPVGGRAGQEALGQQRHHQQAHARAERQPEERDEQVQQRDLLDRRVDQRVDDEPGMGDGVDERARRPVPEGGVVEVRVLALWRVVGDQQPDDEQVPDDARGHGEQPRAPVAQAAEVQAEEGDDDRLVLLDAQQREHERRVEPPASAVDGDEDRCDEHGGEGQLVEVDVQRRLHAPEDEVGGREQGGRAAPEPVTRVEEDRDGRGGEQRGLGEQQHPRVAPDPVQRGEQRQDGREVVAPDVVEPADGVDRRLEPRVVPDRLVEDAEVEPVGLEVRPAQQ